MAGAEIDKLLAQCPAPEAGCFAADPETLKSMVFFDDAGIRTTLSRIAVACDDAAEAGVSLDDVTFREATIERAPEGGHRIGTGKEKRVADLENGDNIAQLGYRLAKCAYVCGSTAVRCPVKTPPDTQ